MQITLDETGGASEIVAGPESDCWVCGFRNRRSCVPTPQMPSRLIGGVGVFNKSPRYTSTTVWNTFPWPASVSAEQVVRIAEISAQILDVREQYRGMGMTLSQQYDALREPGTSPFRDAHEALDTAVIDAYGFVSTAAEI